MRLLRPGTHLPWQSGSWILIVIALALATEAALRLPSVQRLLPAPETSLWHAPLVQAKLDRLRRFQLTQPAQILFVGNSSVQAGINPAVFDSARGADHRPASFNASIEGLPPSSVAVFLPIYLRGGQPRTIIYGLTPQDLNSNSPWAKDVTERVSHSPLAIAQAGYGFWATTISFLLDHSHFFRYRRVLHEWLLTGGSPALAQRPYFDELGFHAIRARLADLTPADRRKPVLRAGLVNYSTAGEQSDSLSAILDQARRRHMGIILVNMPIAAEYQTQFVSPGDHHRYLEALRDIASKAKVPLIDANASLRLTAADFADLNHLNQEGAAQLSSWLAHQVSEAESVAGGQRKRD